MRRRLASGAALAVALASLLALTAPARSAEPAPARAFVAEAERNLGVVAPGERAVAEFRIENRGVVPLELKPGMPEPFVRGVRVEVRGAPVAPGGAATVIVALDTEPLAGPGKFRIPVTTNDPQASSISLAVRAEIRPLLLAEPGYARYVTVQKEREGTIAQTVWSGDGAKFRMLKVESPMAQLRVLFREAQPEERRAGVAGNQWRVESTLASAAPVGALSGDIVILTDHPRQKRLRVPVSGFVRPVFAVTPPVADLGELDTAKSPRFTLHVKNFASEEIRVERAESDVLGIALEVVPLTPGRAYTLRITTAPGLQEGPVSGTIRMFTGSTKAPLIEVPVRGRVLAARAPAGEG